MFMKNLRAGLKDAMTLIGAAGIALAVYTLSQFSVVVAVWVSVLATTIGAAIIYMTKRHDCDTPPADRPTYEDQIIEAWRTAGWLTPAAPEERRKRLDDARNQIREAMQRWDNRLAS